MPCCPHPPYARVNAVAIDRQGIRCITASDDRSVRVWSIYDGRIEQVLSGHGGTGGERWSGGWYTHAWQC